MSEQTLNYIDIFAGCGGMSLGLYNAGWKGLFAIEKSDLAFSTLKHNLMDKKRHFQWPAWLPVEAHDINKVLKNYNAELKALQGTVDLVVGGPPCQGFSTAGRRNEKDTRNKMIDSYIKFISLVRPRILFFENVKGFTMKFNKKGSRGEAYSSYVLRELNNIGYKVHGEIVDFADFGVPQRRKRFILVGVLEGEPEVFFNNIVSNKANFLKQKGLKIRGTHVKEALSDLLRASGEKNSVDFNCFKEGLYSNPATNYQKLLRKDYEGKDPDSHRFPNHRKSTVIRFEYILNNCHKNKNICDKTKKKFKLRKRCVVPLSGNNTSPTLTTLPDDYIHYDEPRILTVREYARIQTFNDWYEFQGKYTTGGKLRTKEVPRYTQVGNAIPPLFGEQCGVVFMEMLK